MLVSFTVSILRTIWIPSKYRHFIAGFGWILVCFIGSDGVDRVKYLALNYN